MGLGLSEHGLDVVPAAGIPCSTARAAGRGVGGSRQLAGRRAGEAAAGGARINIARMRALSLWAGLEKQTVAQASQPPAPCLAAKQEGKYPRE